MGKRIVMTTFGSLGDLNPFISIACELQRRGDHVAIATCEDYRAPVESAGITFRAARPPWEDLSSGLFHHLRASFDDLMAAVRDAELLVTLNIAYAGALV